MTYENAVQGVTVDLSSVSVNQTTNVITIRNGSGKGEARERHALSVLKISLVPNMTTSFIAGPKSDNIDGAGGTDTVSYERSKGVVAVNLTQDTQATTMHRQ